MMICVFFCDKWRKMMEKDIILLEKVILMWTSILELLKLVRPTGYPITLQVV